MARLTWDETGKRLYETGIEKCVLFIRNATEYETGVVWNGLTSVTEAASGAEPTSFYADDIKYLNLYSVEKYESSIEAYTFPPAVCRFSGYKSPIPGTLIAQQPRTLFGLCYQTLIGNDVAGNALGYKIHIVYNCSALLQEISYKTLDNAPELVNFKWEVKTTPVTVGSFKPTSHLILDSTLVTEKNLKMIEDTLYGTEETDSRILMPDEIYQIIKLGLLMNEDEDYIVFGEDRLYV